MSALWANWVHKADSASSRSGAFVYSFEVPSDIAAGVATGFRPVNASPVVFSHGLRFERVSAGSVSVRVITADTLGAASITSDTQFYITRFRERVYYSRGSGFTTITNNGQPFAIQGTLIADTALVYSGEAELHTRFLSAADSVCKYSFKTFVSNILAAATLAFSPLAASASTLTAEQASVSAYSAPMQVTATAADPYAQVDISFEPPTVSVNTLAVDQAVTLASFAPMQVSAYEENVAIEYTSTFLVSAPLGAYAYGVDPSAKTDISFAPMSVYAGETEWAGASVSFAPMEVTALSGSLAASFPIFYAGFAPTLLGREFPEDLEHEFTFDGSVYDPVGDSTVTIIGTVPYVPGSSGTPGDQAVQITDGNSVEIVLPDPVGNDTGTWHTEFSFVPPTGVTENTTIIEFVSDDGTQSIIVYTNTGGETIIVITDTNTGDSVTYVIPPPSNPSEFIHVIIDGSVELGFIVAVNGSQIDPAFGDPNFYFDLPPNITIGGTGDGTFVFDDLFIYNSQYQFEAGEYDIVETVRMVSSHQLNYGLRALDQLHAITQTQTFWTQTLSLTDTVRAILTAQPALAVTLTELVEAEDTINFVEVVTLLDRAGAFDSLETFRQLSVQLSLLAAARDLVAGNPAVVLTDELEAEDATQTRELIQLLESLEAAMTSQQVMTLVVEETLGVQAADSTETLGHYLANVTDNVGAWLGFRLGDETFTGWVMNTEGEKPLSEYTGYNFNSFCRVGDRFYGAGDDGLYLLEGDTDNGEPIDAAIRTMMIDFGSPVQKRVRNAYLGYTASGKLLLRVRTVDQGQMNEQWYEAQELPAQAPREQMVRLGRGLRSRYWQFELINIDGADFEIDTLELHPVYLNRRV
jgi:hypothetical protein